MLKIAVYPQFFAMLHCQSKAANYATVCMFAVVMQINREVMRVDDALSWPEDFSDKINS